MLHKLLKCIICIGEWFYVYGVVTQAILNNYIPHQPPLGVLGSKMFLQSHHNLLDIGLYKITIINIFFIVNSS